MDRPPATPSPPRFWDPSKNCSEDVHLLLKNLPRNAVLFYSYSGQYIQRPEFKGFIDDSFINLRATGRKELTKGGPLVGPVGSNTKIPAEELYIITRLEGGNVRTESKTADDRIKSLETTLREVQKLLSKAKI